MLATELSYTSQLLDEPVIDWTDHEDYDRLQKQYYEEMVRAGTDEVHALQLSRSITVKDITGESFSDMESAALSGTLDLYEAGNLSFDEVDDLIVM